MADTQAALETGDIPQGYEEVPDEPAPPAGYEDAPEAPSKPSFQPTIFGIPTAAAARIGGVVTRVFNKAGEDAAKNFVSTFSSLADQDKADLVANGYGNYSGPGALLQHAGDTFNSGLAIIKDGFFATGAAIEGGVSGAEKQFAIETGHPEKTEAAGREGAFIGMAAQSDIGTMHGMGMIDAAKANMAAPGVWGDVYRMDQTEGGGLTRVALGKFPDGGAEAAQQAKVAATNLGLGDKTADLIHRTYLDTGRPPAETLMDAQTDHGGVLSDLLAGKTPTAYTGAPRALTPEELAAAKPPAAPEIPDLSKIPGTIEQAEKLPRAGNNIGGLEVTRNIPNKSSIAASLGDDYTEIPGIRAIPMSEFPGAGSGYVSASDIARVNDLAEQIKANGYIDPLIVVMDKDGPYVLEGGHRLDALKQLGHEDVPAMVIVDHSNEHPVATAAYDAIEKQRAADQAAFLKERGMTQAQANALPVADKRQLNADFQKWRQAKPSVSPEGGPTAEPVSGTQPTLQPPSAPTETVFPQVEQPEAGVSKVGKRVEAAAIEDGLTRGFPKTAEYGTKEVEDQKVRVADLVGNDPDRALAVMRGQQPVPDGMSPAMLLRGLGILARQTKDGALLEELANSPLASSPAYAAQELRLTQELDPAMAAIQELKQSLTKAAGGVEEVTRKQRAFKAAANDAEVKGIVLPKEQLSWDRFLESIKC